VDCEDITPPAHAHQVEGQVEITYTTAGGWTEPAVCAWACDTDFAVVDGACVSSQQVPCASVTPPANGHQVDAPVTITYTTAGGWTSPTACAWACDANYFSTGTACINSQQVPCASVTPPTNGHQVDAPVTITYTTAGGWTSPTACAWACDANYFSTGTACINSQQVSCASVTPPTNGHQVDAQVTITYTTAGGWTDPTACTWTCDTDYFNTGTACINSQQVDCADITPPTNGHQVEAPVTITYTTAGGWTSATPCAWACDGGYHAEGAACATNVAIEWCNLQWPTTYAAQVHVAEPIYGQVYSTTGAGTADDGALPSVMARLCWSGTAPTFPVDLGAMTCLDATYNVDQGDNDEYVADLTLDAVGTYYYVYAFSGDGGATWTACDQGGVVNDPVEPGVATITDDLCAGVDCGAHGSCSLGVCTCDPGWAGVFCEHCATDYAPEGTGGACIHTKDVACTPPATVPANAHVVIADVTVTYTGVYPGGTWSTPAECAIACDADYAPEGTACIHTKDVACTPPATVPANAHVVIADVTVTYTGVYGAGGAWSTPAECAIACDADYSPEGTGGACIHTKLVSCTPPATIPANAHAVIADVTVTYTGVYGAGGAWSSPAECAIACDADYAPEGTACIHTKDVACTPPATVPANAHVVIADVTVTYTGVYGAGGAWSTPAECAIACDADYAPEGTGGACIHTKDVACTPPATIPANAHAVIADVTVTYTGVYGAGGAWSAAAECAIACDSGYHLSGTTCELDVVITWCNVQWPTSYTEAPFVPTDVYGRFYSTSGVGTASDGALPGVEAMLCSSDVAPGFPVDLDLLDCVPATYNTQAGNDDEYVAELAFDLPGTYYYLYAFSGDGGASWTVCDRDDIVGDPVNPGVADIDPCVDVTCGTHETCVDGTCECSPGYHLEGTACVANVSIDWCKVDEATFSVATGASANLHAQIWSDDGTAGAGQLAGIQGRLCYSDQTFDGTAGFTGLTCVGATYSGESGDNDVYAAAFTSALPDTYHYIFAFSGDGGSTWTMCDPTGDSIPPLAPGVGDFLQWTYSQNFDSLATSGTTNTWTDNITIPLWYSNRTVYIGSNGSLSNGGLHSFGSTGVNERALGSIGSTSANPVLYAVKIANPYTSAVTSVAVQYRGEQWRNGDAAAHSLTVDYLAGSCTTTTLTEGTWTAVPALTFTSPTTGGTGQALDGNLPANSATLNATLPVAVPLGECLWLRWTDINDAGNDHGLGIDDFSITVY
jgi:hypothetical protein